MSIIDWFIDNFMLVVFSTPFWLPPLVIIVLLIVGIFKSSKKEETKPQSKEKTLEEEFKEFQALKKIATSDDELEQFFELKFGKRRSQKGQQSSQKGQQSSQKGQQKPKNP